MSSKRSKGIKSRKRSKNVEIINDPTIQHAIPQAIPVTTVDSPGASLVQPTAQLPVKPKVYYAHRDFVHVGPQLVGTVHEKCLDALAKREELDKLTLGLVYDGICDICGER